MPATRGAVLDEIRITELIEHLDAWIAAPTWSVSAEYLAEHAAVLLTDEAEVGLTQLVADAPERLRYLGLLGLARAVGITEAYALISGGAEIPPGADLAVARLVAGFLDGSAEPQFVHGLTALEVGTADEAASAMARCRDVYASWERPSFLG